MEAKNLTTQGKFLGAFAIKDFTTGLETGETQITIGERVEGRFIQTNIKARMVNISDFESIFDEKVEITLENVSINAYASGNRAALSIKAKSAFIELV
ncbi:TPA: hypothetical protein ACGO65_002191 [Streptococcus suis]